jgi:hypothetical protein
MPPVRIARLQPVILAAALAFVAHAIPRAAQGPTEWNRAVTTDLTEERVIGLLNLPDVIAAPCSPSQTRVNVYAGASSSSAAVGSLEYVVTDRQPDGFGCGQIHLMLHRTDGRPDETVPTEESEYDLSAAIVYERSGPWFRIALQHGSAWLAHIDVGDFLAYPDLLTHRLAYINQEWDGRLWTAPGRGVPARIPAGWTPHLQNASVEVLDVRRVGRDTWIRVRLEVETCGERLDGLTPVAGWIPAYDTAGGPSVWFYSRGC